MTLSPSRVRTAPPAFTPIELLVGIAIIPILLRPLLPPLPKGREAAPNAARKNNLKQLALAAHSYESATGHFPAGSVVRQGTQASGPGNTGTASYYDTWAITMLPYLEQTALFAKWNPNMPNIAPDSVAGANF